MHNADHIADALMQLINSSPRSPRKDQIVALLNGSGTGYPKPDMVMAVGGAAACVTGRGMLFEGFHVSHPEPTELNCKLAIIDWMRERVLLEHGHPE